jgi:cold shock CspA family protein
MKRMTLALAAFIFAAPAAYAETLTGTVKNVDSQNGEITLTRTDNQEDVKVKVADTSSLARVQAGSTLTLDATQGMLGGWEAQTVSTSATGGAAATGTDGTGGGAEGASGGGTSNP